MAPPQISVVLLTLNEERNIGACLAALASQTRRDFEVIIIDAASTDGTLRAIREAQKGFPVPLRLEASGRRLPIGEARNLGVHLANAGLVAFLSADAEMEPTWMERSLASIQGADMVFGRQVHAPHTWSAGACVRGLRYHFPDHKTDDPLRYASNVAALYRTSVLRAFPFDPWANAAEDLLLVRRAAQVGYKAVYDPAMVVRHHDVATSRQEMRKSIREGAGWALYRAELGIFWQVLAWAAAVIALVALLVFWTSLWSLLLLAGVLWAPAILRALRRAGKMPFPAILKGLFASPVFDLVFAANYVRGLFGRPPHPAPTPHAKETPR